MAPRRRTVRPALAGLVLALLLSGCAAPGRDVGPLVGNVAPDFTVQPVTGGPPWSLAGHRGQVVMLDLMGVNCPPCRREMPHLVAFAAARADDPGLALLSIDMASVFPALGARDLREIEAFAREFNATWPFAPGGGDVGRDYALIALPTKVLIDADGVIRAKVSTEIGSVGQLEELVGRARRP